MPTSMLGNMVGPTTSVVGVTAPVSRREAADLAKELRRIGYRLRS